MLSIPDMTPLAIDGTAPMRTTNRMARSVSWNRATASGSHATEGIVWNPVINEPRALRSIRLWATTTPSTVPITTASR